MFRKKSQATVANNRPYTSIKLKWQLSELLKSLVLCQNQSIFSPLNKTNMTGRNLFSQCAQTFEEPLREVYFMNWLSPVVKLIPISILFILFLLKDHHKRFILQLSRCFLLLSSLNVFAFTEIHPEFVPIFSFSLISLFLSCSFPKPYPVHLSSALLSQTWNRDILWGILKSYIPHVYQSWVMTPCWEETTITDRFPEPWSMALILHSPWWKHVV